MRNKLFIAVVAVIALIVIVFLVIFTDNKEDVPEDDSSNIIGAGPVIIDLPHEENSNVYTPVDIDGDGFITSTDAELDMNNPKRQDRVEQGWTSCDFHEVDLSSYTWFEFKDYGSVGQYELLWPIVISVDNYYGGDVQTVFAFDDSVDIVAYDNETQTYTYVLHSEGFDLTIEIDCFNEAYRVL